LFNIGYIAGIIAKKKYDWMENRSIVHLESAGPLAAKQREALARIPGVSLLGVIQV